MEEMSGNNYHRKQRRICAILALLQGVDRAAAAAEREETLQKYSDAGERKLMQVVCNRCGRHLKVEEGRLKEGCFSATAAFGYFSRKDGSVHHFDLCEDCYDDMTAQFVVPVGEETATELL